MRFNLHVSTPKQELSRLSRLSWRRLSGSCSPSYSMDVGLDMRRRRVVHHCSDFRDVDSARNNVRTSDKAMKSQQILRILRATSYPLRPLRPLSYPWAVRNLLNTMWWHAVWISLRQPHTRHLTFPVLKRFSNFPRSFCVSVDENSAMHSGDKSNGVGTSSCESSSWQSHWQPGRIREDTSNQRSQASCEMGFEHGSKTFKNYISQSWPNGSESDIDLYSLSASLRTAETIKRNRHNMPQSW